MTNIDTTVSAGVGQDVKPEAFAKQIADMLAGSDMFQKLVDDNEAAANTLKRGPFYTMHVIEATVGTENMARIPWPATDADAVKGTNDMADEYEASVPNGKGGWKKAKKYITNTIADLTPKGQRLVTAIAQWNAAIHGNTAAPQDMRNTPPYLQASKLKGEEEAQRRYRKLVKDAVKLHHNLNRIRALPGISVSFETVDVNGGKEYAPTNTPIIITDISDLAGGSAVRTEAFSAGDVIGFDVAKALREKDKHPNLWTSLKYSGGRDQEPEGDGATGGVALDLNMVESQLAGIGHFVENSANVGPIYARVKKEPGFRRTLRLVRDALDQLLTKSDVVALLNADDEADRAAAAKAKAEAAARSAA